MVSSPRDPRSFSTHAGNKKWPPVDHKNIGTLGSGFSLIFVKKKKQTPSKGVSKVFSGRSNCAITSPERKETSKLICMMASEEEEDDAGSVSLIRSACFFSYHYTKLALFRH